MALPSSETAGEKSGNDFIGGDVKLRVSPLSVDNSVSPLVTIDLPSGNQANAGPKAYRGSGTTSATRRSGPPMAGMTMKAARSFDARTKPMDRPSGEKAGLLSSAASVVSRRGVGEPISLT